MLKIIIAIILVFIVFILGCFVGDTKVETEDKNDDIYCAGDILINLNPGIDEELISIRCNTKIQDWLYRNEVKFNIEIVSDEKNTSSNEEE